MSETSKKTALIQFLQKYLGRTLTRHDMSYATTGSDGVLESRLTLHCLDNESFSGALGCTEKEAEHNAAAVALARYASEAASLPPSTKAGPGTKPSRRKPSKAGPLVLDSNSKSDLIRFLQKFLGRTMTAADTEYLVVQGGAQLQVAQGMFQATLTIVCLDGECHTGEPCESPKAAEHAAAERALEAHGAEVQALCALGGGAPAKQAAPGLGSARWTPPSGAARPRPAPAQRKRLAPGGLLVPGGTKGEAEGNHKTKLIQFLQSYKRRTLTKEDVIYACLATHGGYTASVTLRCHEGHQFSGAAGADDKEAQQNAAAAALQAFASEVADWEALPPKEKKPRTQRARRVNQG